MPRDPGLEELVKSSLGHTRGLSEKSMFGGWAWLLHGNLLCGARRGSLPLRVGKDNEAWANQIPGVATAIMGGRRSTGAKRSRVISVRMGPRLSIFPEDIWGQANVFVAFPLRKATPRHTSRSTHQEKCFTPDAYGTDALRQKLIDAALNFTNSLPKKKKQ